MPLNVYGDKELPEFEAGQQMASFLRQSLVGTSGDLVIRSSIVLFGQKRRDLDLLVLGRFPTGLETSVWDAAVPRHKVRKDETEKVHFFNFVFCVEVKDHTPEDIRFDNTRALVRYRDGWSDATGQSDEQKYALINYLKEFLGWSPFVCNFLWFRNLEEVGFPEFPNNFLPRHFGLDYLLSKAVAQKQPYKRDDDMVFYATRANEAQQLVADEQRIFRIFEEYKSSLGALSRARLEKITKERLVANQAYASAIGKKLVLVKGRAGTGKTIKLLHIAYDLCVHRGERVLLLTYNQLLVSDIRRMLTLAGVGSDLDGSTVEIETIHAFVRRILQAFEIDFNNDDYLQCYNELKQTLLDYLDGGLITAVDIEAKRQSGLTELRWDKVLIDEGQDWPEDEKRILYALFGSNNFVVACGMGQLVRSAEPADWMVGVDYHKPIVYEKRSLRQKRNLCAFANAYADHFDIAWDLEPSEDLPGGKVIIAVGSITQELIRALQKKCVADGNQAYEFLFLAPPGLTVRDGDRRRFSLAEQFESWGVHVWDGIPRDTRSEFPTDIRQHRVTTYESARGLEGWIVACLELDCFHDYKLANPYILPELHSPQLELELTTSEEQAMRLAHEWVMIALTRAIDTLLINLHNASSDYSRALLSIATARKGYVEVIDNS